MTIALVTIPSVILVTVTARLHCTKWCHLAVDEHLQLCTTTHS